MLKQTTTDGAHGNFNYNELYSIVFKLVQKAFSPFKEKNIFTCKILNISSDKCDPPTPPQKSNCLERQRERSIEVLLCMLDEQEAPLFLCPLR